MHTKPLNPLIVQNRGGSLTEHQQMVLELIRSIPGHPDAVMIFQKAKERDNHISLATIYRSLAVLKSAGLIEEDHLGEEHGHFEAVEDTHHYHFTCINCMKVIEFEAPGIPRITQEVSNQRKLWVTETHFQLRGYCPECKETMLKLAGQEAQFLPLTSLTNGMRGIVNNLEGGNEFIARAAGLGFSIGAQVTVLQNHGHGPIVISLLGAHIALGQHEAQRIQIQPL